MQPFDANQFLDMQQTEVNERRAPVPQDNPDRPDGCYIATIGEVKTESGTIGKGEKTGQPWVSVMVPLQIDIPQQLQDALKLPAQMTFTDRVFLDMTPGGAGIDNSPGKNRRQREYRDALDMNKPGEAFAWRLASGRQVRVKLIHDIRQSTVPGEQPYIVEEVGPILKPT